MKGINYHSFERQFRREVEYRLLTFFTLPTETRTKWKLCSRNYYGLAEVDVGGSLRAVCQFNLVNAKVCLLSRVVVRETTTSESRMIYKLEKLHEYHSDSSSFPGGTLGKLSRILRVPELDPSTSATRRTLGTLWESLRRSIFELAGIFSTACANVQCLIAVLHHSFHLELRINCPQRCTIIFCLTPQEEREGRRKN